METVTIRELSAEVIARASSEGYLLGITNMGAPVGVVVPLSREALQRTTVRDAERVRERAEQAVRDLESGEPMSTVDELLQQAEPGGHAGPERVSIRQLSGARLEQAARDGRTLIITSGRVALALLVPVTPSWLEDVVTDKIAHFLGGSPSDPPADVDDDRGAGPVAVAEDLPLSPAIGMLTPRREVLAQQISLGREIIWRRAIGIRVDADPQDGRGRLLGVVTDTVAKVLGEPVTRELASIDESVVYNAILGLIDELRARIRYPEHLIGIGVEIGGHVHDGEIIRSFNVHWEDFSLADRLNAAFGLPVVVENDANALAILERRFYGVKEDNLAVVLVTYQGIGCGLVLDGHLYRGSRGMAGELGHIPVGQSASRPAGGRGGEMLDRCRCGNPECLELVATPRAIGQAEAVMSAGGYQAARSVMPVNDRVRREFERAGRALGRGIATVINLFNPAAIVFYGPAELFGQSREFHIGADLRRYTEKYPYLAGMVEEVDSHQFSVGASECRFIVRRAVDGQRASAAAASLINRLMPTSQVLETRPVMVQAVPSEIPTRIPGSTLTPDFSAWIREPSGK
jgi:predicted NBD/HSP70 family sugar kinase/antitoxin (DNA-binding transcriptional repressor) of toxin-antitoxin stability system